MSKPVYINNEIKVKLPITEENLGYEHNTGWTDKDIKLYLSKKQIFGLDMVPQSDSKFRKTFEPTEENLIKYFDDHMSALPDDSLEFIPRKYWCKIEDLRGAGLKQLSHPIFKLGHQIIKDNFVKHCDTILIQACGNMKPYIDNPNYRNHSLSCQRKGMCDMFVSSWNLVPIDFTPFFPWRYYEWNHKLETPFMTNLCIQNEVYNIVDIVTYFDYKKVVVWGPGEPDYFYVELFRRLKMSLPDRELIFVLDKERMDILNSKYSNMFGLTKSRYCVPKEITDYVDSLLEQPKGQECWGVKDEKQIEYIKNR